MDTPGWMVRVEKGSEAELWFVAIPDRTAAIDFVETRLAASSDIRVIGVAPLAVSTTSLWQVPPGAAIRFVVGAPT